MFVFLRGFSGTDWDWMAGIGMVPGSVTDRFAVETVPQWTGRVIGLELGVSTRGCPSQLGGWWGWGSSSWVAAGGAAVGGPAVV